MLRGPQRADAQVRNGNELGLNSGRNYKWNLQSSLLKKKKKISLLGNHGIPKTYRNSTCCVFSNMPV